MGCAIPTLLGILKDAIPHFLICPYLKFDSEAKDGWAHYHVWNMSRYLQSADGQHMSNIAS